MGHRIPYYPYFDLYAAMPRKSTLNDLLTQDTLSGFAGELYYDRGVAYYQSGAVELLACDDQRITAHVEGSHTYTVTLTASHNELDWMCSCPLGEEGACCKHVVATGLAWLARKPAAPARRARAAAYEAPRIKAIRKFIENSDKQTLAELLLRHAEQDGQFAATLEAAALRGGKAKPAQLKDLIRKAFHVDDYVDYRDAATLVDRAGNAATLIEDAIDNGNARLAAELAQYALQLGADTINHVDDSDGGLGDVLAGIACLHAEACEKGALPATALARSVFALQMNDPIGVVQLEPYLAALGEAGLAEYRKLARGAWNRLPALTKDAAREADSTARYVVTGIMKTLARLDGDVDAAIDILKHDLSTPHRFLDVAKALAQDGRHDEALQWAQDGRAQFPDAIHGPLDDYLAAEYHRSGRHDEGIAIHWAHFHKRPALQSYQTLKASAEQNQTWNTWREKALAHLENAAQKNTNFNATWRYASGNNLIEIHLWEGHPERALKAARLHQCTPHLWLQLAAALEPGQPEEAILIYQQQMDKIITGQDKGAYHAAGDLMARLHKLMIAANRRAEYVTYLAGVRLRHKAKRNFMAVLDMLAAKKRV